MSSSFSPREKHWQAACQILLNEVPESKEHDDEAAYRTPIGKNPIIDDEPLTGRFIENVLENAGFEVLYSQNALEGLHWATENPPDLIITDYEMDGINGAELCVCLKSRAETKSVPVILISGNVGTDGDELSLFSGGAAYFDKPIVMGRLVSKVQALLSDARLTHF